jgi:hypothetical protein
MCILPAFKVASFFTANGHVMKMHQRDIYCISVVLMNTQKNHLKKLDDCPFEATSSMNEAREKREWDQQQQLFVRAAKKKNNRNYFSVFPLWIFHSIKRALETISIQKHFVASPN